jgi:hypothetical protein
MIDILAHSLNGPNCFRSTASPTVTVWLACKATFFNWCGNYHETLR